MRIVVLGAVLLMSCNYGATCRGQWTRDYDGNRVCSTARGTHRVDARARTRVAGSAGYYTETTRPPEAQAEVDRRQRRNRCAAWVLLAPASESAGRQCYCDCLETGRSNFQCRQACGLYR